MRQATTTAAIILAVLLPASALAQPAPSVHASDAWARATPPGASTGAFYVTLTSTTGDKLIGAATPAAANSAVHETHMEGDIMRMRPMEGGLDLPAGRRVSLSPHGLHIMMEGLKGPLKQGSQVKQFFFGEKNQKTSVYWLCG